MIVGVKVTPLILNDITKIVCPILTNFKKEEVIRVNVPKMETATIALCNGHCRLVGNFAELPLIGTKLNIICLSNTDL